MIHAFNDDKSKVNLGNAADLPYSDETLINNIAILFHNSGKKMYVLPLLEFSLTLYPDSAMTYLNIAYFLSEIGEWNIALKYLNYIKESDSQEIIGLRNHILSNISGQPLSK